MEIVPDPIHVALLALPFFTAAVGLHLILWRPLLAYLDARDAASARARHEAEELDGAAAEQLGKIEARLADARQRASSLRHDARVRALGREADIVSKARTEADQRVSEALQQIGNDRTAASETLRSTAAELSTGIASRVLGRKVAASRDAS